VSFDPVSIYYVSPFYTRWLWPLAWISIALALTALPSLFRGGRKAPEKPLIVALHVGLGCATLAVGALSLWYYIRVGEPFIREYLRAHPASPALRAASSREYVSAALGWAVSLVALAASVAMRKRKSGIQAGGA
jgi:hypothetical protein